MWRSCKGYARTVRSRGGRRLAPAVSLLSGGIIPVRGGGVDQWRKVHVNESFTGILEINGNAISDDRLDLAEAPVGLVRVADEISWNEVRSHSVLRFAGLFVLHECRCGP